MQKKIIIVFNMFLVVYSSVYSQAVQNAVAKTSSFTIQTIIPLVKDSINIIFFIIGGIVTILSYIQARKTIFTPLRTETFKIQLKALEEILEYFNKSVERNIDDRFDYNNIVKINSSMMYDDYVSAFFSKEIKINTDKMKERYKDSVGAVVTQSFAEKNMEIVDNYITEDIKENTSIDNPAIIYAQWQEYEYGWINYTNKYDEQNKTLFRFFGKSCIAKRIKSINKEVSCSST